MNEYDKCCTDCWEDGDNRLGRLFGPTMKEGNIASVQASLDKGTEEGALIIEVGDHLRSKLGDAYTTNLGVLVEQCLIHVLYWRNERKEKVAV